MKTFIHYEFEYKTSVGYYICHDSDMRIITADTEEEARQLDMSNWANVRIIRVESTRTVLS